jgi:hypothetical protein
MALTREQREKLAHMRAVATSLIRCYCNGPGLPADHPQRAALANIAICAREMLEMLEDDEADAAEASSSRARLGGESLEDTAPARSGAEPSSPGPG